jgi:hypothetical protein
MRAFLAAIALAAGICCFSGQASAWFCQATGPKGVAASGSALLEERARGIALRRCERRNGGPCTIQFCRP